MICVLTTGSEVPHALGMQASRYQEEASNGQPEASHEFA